MKAAAASSTAQPRAFDWQCEARNKVRIRCQCRAGHEGAHEAHDVVEDISYVWPQQ